MQLDNFLKQDWTHIDLQVCNLYVILDDVGAITYLQRDLKISDDITLSNARQKLREILEEKGVKIEYVDYKTCVKISPAEYYGLIENYNIRIDTFAISKFYDAPTFLLKLS